MKEIFQGHDELLLKFQTFLPDGFVISLPPKKRKVITKEFALKYISKVKVCVCIVDLYDGFFSSRFIFDVKSGSVFFFFFFLYG